MTHVDRRRVLETCVASVLSVSIAGCLGDDDADDGDVLSEEDLAIDHVRFVAEQPPDYREYTEVGDATYEPGEVVWVYFEPTGLGTESAGEGAVHVSLQAELEVSDPAGETFFFEEEINRDVPADALDEQFLFWYFQPEVPVTAGEYEAELTLVDEVSDDRVERRETFTILDEQPPAPADELGIEHVRFVSDEPTGYREYEEVLAGTYTEAHDVWIYYEPVGVVPGPGSDDRVEVAVVTILEVTDPEGETHHYDDFHHERVPEDEFDELFFFWTFTPELPGEYEVRLELFDEHSGEHTEAIETVLVTSADHAEAFQELLTTQLGVEIESFAADDGVVELTYRSRHPVDSDPGAEEIGLVGGAFALQIEEGWEVERLEAAVTDGDENDYRFEVRRETAAGFLEDELTREEFAEAILDTLEPA